MLEAGKRISLKQANPTRRTQLIITALLLFGCLAWIANMRLTAASCPNYPEKISGAPDFIETVWPPPDAEIEFACYMKKELTSFISIEGNVNIVMIPIKSFKSQEVDYQETHPDEIFPPFEDRVSLYIDEKQVKAGVQIAGSDSTPYGDRFPNELEYLYVFKSYPLLFPGSHTAKVVIALKNKERVEYQWHFKIRW